MLLLQREPVKSKPHHFAVVIDAKYVKDKE